MAYRNRTRTSINAQSKEGFKKKITTDMKRKIIFYLFVYPIVYGTLYYTLMSSTNELYLRILYAGLISLTLIFMKFLLFRNVSFKGASITILRSILMSIFTFVGVVIYFQLFLYGDVQPLFAINTEKMVIEIGLQAIASLIIITVIVFLLSLAAVYSLFGRINR